jgi:hypothetical protein
VDNSRKFASGIER